MISHLFDTNTVIALIGRKSDALISRVLQSPQGSIGLSSVVAYELYFGAQKSAKVQHNLETLRLLLVDFPILDFDRNDAFVAGEIRAALAARGKPIGVYDVLIAGQAKARSLTLSRMWLPIEKSMNRLIRLTPAPGIDVDTIGFAFDTLMTIGEAHP